MDLQGFIIWANNTFRWLPNPNPQFLAARQ
jgi:hypothetical protein